MKYKSNTSSSLVKRASIRAISPIIALSMSITLVINTFLYYSSRQVKVVFHLLAVLILLIVSSAYAGDGDYHDLGHQSDLVGGAGVAYNSYVSDNKKVVSSIAQLGEPLAAITGGCTQVKNLLGSGTDPHLYRLSRADVLQMHKANLVMNLGLHLELQMQPILDDMSLFKDVHSVGDMIPAKRLLEVSPLVFDPHLWMDPLLWLNVITIASHQVVKSYPECKKTIIAGLKDYTKKIHDLDSDAQKAFQAIPAESKVLVTSHDAFGYFGKKYGIKVLAIQGISTDRQISIRRISRLVDFLVENKIEVVFVESSVNPRDMNAVIEGAANQGYKIDIGGTLYSDAMGASGAKEGTYIGMFKHNMRTILNAWNVEDHPFAAKEA
ncbi:MAG: zinc ABC transporter solute-binding protein [Candidatus Portiera sp.]|nr:zinc ABC transporter solute-binding protein [Portiera sp.]